MPGPDRPAMRRPARRPGAGHRGLRGGRAVLLPQVATENNYNRDQFLTALCHKAGLYGDYWQEKMLKLKVFTADIFAEK